MFKIVNREEMSDGTVVLNDIDAPKIARKAKPGQFVILKANEEGERIPLTMAETDPDKGTITVIYQVVGKSTALFKTLEVGDGYQDVGFRIFLQHQGVRSLDIDTGLLDK